MHSNVYSVWLHICLHPLLVSTETSGSWNTLDAGNDAASNPKWQSVWIQNLHSVWLYICLYLFLLYYNNCRNFNYFGCRELCCIQYWHQFVCIQYLQLVWLHVCLHFCCSITIIARTWNTLDAETDAASNTGTNLSAFNTCIQFFCMYACIHCCFYMKIYCTGNTLYTVNNAASNTFKLYACIHDFCTVCNNKKWLIH